MYEKKIKQILKVFYQHDSPVLSIPQSSKVLIGHFNLVRMTRGSFSILVPALTFITKNQM